MEEEKGTEDITLHNRAQKAKEDNKHRQKMKEINADEVRLPAIRILGFHGRFQHLLVFF